LFEIQGALLSARQQGRTRGPGESPTLQTYIQANGGKIAPGSNGRDDPPASDQERLSTSTRPPRAPCSKSPTIAQCFLRLSNVDAPCLAACGRYEAGLGGQAPQTIWPLDVMSRPAPESTRRPFRNPVALRFRRAELF